MKMKTACAALMAMAAVLSLTAAPLLAHHGTNINYDRSKQWTKKAVVTEFKYVNPHAQLFFDVTDDEILGRLGRRRTVEQRADDDPDVVATRLRAYREQTAPLLAWYDARQALRRVPAVGTIEEIAERVGRALGR